MMPIVTNPLLLMSWQSKFQKLMEGKLSLIELTIETTRAGMVCGQEIGSSGFTGPTRCFER